MAWNRKGGCVPFCLKASGGGGRPSPAPRLLRILRNLLIKQLPTAATVTQRAVSGQASFAGRAVRKAHSESQADRPENEFIHFPAGFLAFFCPETRLAPYCASGAVCLFVLSPNIAGIGPRGRIPPLPVTDAGATMPNCGRRAAEALTFFPSIFLP